MDNNKVYKLLKMKRGKLYPLYIETNRELPIGQWLEAHCGELVDNGHVKASGCSGSLSLRPGFHSTTIPWTEWIGKKRKDGTLVQRKNTVWCECEIDGDELEVKERNGLKTIPNGWYRFKTNSKQKEPWIICQTL